MNRVFIINYNFVRILFCGFTLMALLAPVVSVNGQISLSKPLIEKWQRKLEHETNFTPTTGSNSLFISQLNGDLLSIDMHDGSYRWKAQIGGIITSATVADEQAVYVASASNSPAALAAYPLGSLRRISSESGVTVWVRSFDAPICDGIMSNNSAIFGSTSDGHLFSVEKKTGDILWNTSLSPIICSRLILSNNRLLYATTTGNIASIDPKTGKQLKNYRTRSVAANSFSVRGSDLYWGTDDYYVNAWDQRLDISKWRVYIGSKIQSITPTNKGLLVIAMDNSVYMFSYRNGSKVWKRLLTERTAALPLTKGDTVLIAALLGGECIVLALSNGERINLLSLGDGNNISASPFIYHDLLFITTHQRIFAFAGTLPNTQERELNMLPR